MSISAQTGPKGKCAELERVYKMWKQEKTRVLGFNAL